MARYHGGMQAQGGYYWNPRSWEVEVVPPEGARLKGAPETSYVKVPFPLLFVIVPLLGALFLMFLPFIGFALAAQAAVMPIIRVFHRSATDLAATVSPGWRPGEAHLTGKREESAGVEEKGPTAGSERLDALEREIEEKRKS